MKPAPFTYASAGSIAQAIELLGTSSGARVFAGGQSLGPMLNLRLARPATLIDIKRAADLRAIAADSSRFRIGPCWTHAEIEDGAVEDPANGLLRHVAHGIAYRAVRNRGTIGGSLSHADPAADWLTTMALLDATLTLQGPAGTRVCSAAGFMQGPFATALRAGELLTAIELPRLSSQARWGYLKICRKTGEFARAIGAVVHDPRQSLTRVVCGATGGAPLILPDTAARLATAGPAAASETAASEITARGASPLHVVAVRRALAQLAA